MDFLAFGLSNKTCEHQKQNSSRLRLVQDVCFRQRHQSFLSFDDGVRFVDNPAKTTYYFMFSLLVEESLSPYILNILTIEGEQV
jgi:hypothetical protein